MLDIKFIRENEDSVKKAIKVKGIDLNLNQLLKADKKRRKLLSEYEQVRAKQNQQSDLIANAEPPNKAQLIKEMRSVSDHATQLKDQLMQIDEEYTRLMLWVPQIPSKNSPLGGEENNKVIRSVGQIPKFDFEPKSHIEIGEALDLVDFKRGVKLMGMRGYVLKNQLALYEQAIMNYALDFMRERGLTQITPPVLAREEFFVGTGHFPFSEKETFKVFDQKNDEQSKLYLIGTSEIPLCAYHSQEILKANDLPLKYMAKTNCFRTEVGSYGKDTHGLYRVKQFNKVEQVFIMDDNQEKCLETLQQMVKYSEEFLQSLELPYRVLQIATGDMGAGKVEMYDIETYMPSRKNYGETHSASYLGDWQARRLNLRYKDKNETKFCHTLNNTVVASPRILIPLLECHQDENGFINIPQAVRPYLKGLTKIKNE